MIKKYLARHFQFEKVFQPGNGEEEPRFMPKRKRSKSFFIFLQLLRLLPYACGAAFIVSFFYDFGADDEIIVAGQHLSLDAFVRMVSVSGLIGYSTNWIAIKMLFKPVFRRPIWGQGLIPAQKDRIVWNLAGGIHKHILNEDLIRDRITESGIIRKVNQLLIKGVESLLDDEEFIREVKAFAYTQIKSVMAKQEVRDRFTAIIDEKLDENLNKGLGGFVFQAYKKLNKKEYEAILNNILNKVPGTVVDIIEEVENEAPRITESIKSREADMESFFLRLVMDLLEKIDIRSLLSQQMAHFDEAKLEQMIWSATNEQLLYIQYLGTLLGILGGFLIWQPLFVGIAFVSIVLLLGALDIFLYRIKKDNIGSR
jgi:uncharacterized membrane protein YheB (UPF0754 family)